MDYSNFVNTLKTLKPSKSLKLLEGLRVWVWKI